MKKIKIVMKVDMKCEKCRTKAFKIVASSCGVNEVKIEGKEKDQIVVIGEGVDPISLVMSLRKKVGRANILTLDEVKPTSEQQQPPKKKSSSNPNRSPDQTCQCHHQPHFVGRYIVYDTPPGSCCLM
ncbi:hypothetical protein NE237_032984 [Protea cynaroides]|uniref:HMA domain-containing protein n=1 Tax=Protea cynaroides TaxID=273540 RepID=A0A9Q0L452_9MAGN|nr:hypothetical protein NE237_032984 [Protea cynaroides]